MFIEALGWVSQLSQPLDKWACNFFSLGRASLFALTVAFFLDRYSQVQNPKLIISGCSLLGNIGTKWM